MNGVVSRARLAADLDDAMIEIDRLREALRQIANPPEVIYGYGNELVQIARAALGKSANSHSETDA